MSKNYTTDEDKAVQNLLVESLEHSIEHLDAHTLSRLNQARHQALARAERPRLLNSQWLKAATFAVLVVTVINGWMLLTTPDVPRMNTDDFEMLIANEDFELVQDLDFIAWMIEEDHAS
jgi:hypothetical protein